MPSSSGVRAGRAFVVIEALDKTGTILNKISGSLTRWANKMEAHGQKVLSRLFMVSLPAAFGMNFYKNFDDMMRKVEARSTGTAKEMQGLRDQARELGRTSAFSAEQVGALQNELAVLGFSRGDMLNMTEPITLLAKAGADGDPLLNMQQAAQAVGGALRGFGLDSSHTAELVDKFVAAVNASNFSLDDLVTSMSYASKVAETYAVDMDEVLATLAMLRNLNLDASTVGTAFRNLLLEMSDASGIEKFNEKLKALTGTTLEFKDALTGNLKDPAMMLFEIGQAIRGLGTADVGDLFNTLFGKRAVVPSLAMARGAKSYEEMLATIRNSHGLAAATAEKMEAGIGGAWRRLVHALQNVAITASEILEPALTDISGKLVKLLNDFANWALANRGFVIGLMEAGIVAGTYGVSLVALASTMKILAMTLVPIGFLFTTISGLIKFSAVLYAAHIASVMAMKVAYLTFRGAVIATNAVLALVPTALLVIKTAMTGLQIAFTVIQAEITAFWAAVKTMVTVFRALLLAYGVTQALALAGAYIVQTAAAYMAALATNVLSASIVTLGIAITGIILPVLAVAAAIYFLGGAIVAIASNALTLGVSGFVGVLQTAADSAVHLGNTLANVFNFAYSRGKAIGSTLIDTFQAVNAALQLGDTDEAWRIGVEGLEIAWLEGLDAALTAWNEFSNSVLKTCYMIRGFLKDWLKFFMEDLGMVGGAMGAAGNSIMAAVQVFFDKKIADDTRDTLSGAMGYYGEKADEELQFRRMSQRAASILRQQEIERKKLYLKFDKEAVEEAARAKAAEDKHRDDAADPAAGLPPSAHEFASITAPSVFEDLKALEGMELFSKEAMKQAYENAMRAIDGEDKDLAEEELAVMKDIRGGINTLVENIAIA